MPQPESEKHEYWILDSVATGSYPLYLLSLPQDDLEETFNRPSHGLSDQQLFDVVNSLFEAGKLIATRRDIPERTFFIPSRDQIEAALAQDDIDLDYWLTAKGGLEWEKLSKPNWEKFIFAAYSFRDHRCIVSGAAPSFVEQYLDYQHYLWSASIIPESKQWQVLRPWQATYWKQLPVGYQVTFQVMCREPDYDVSPEVQKWLDELRNWYARLD